MAELHLEPAEAALPTAALDRFSSLHDWRRQIADLYAGIRAMPADQGWAHWRRTRDRLFREHPQSPLAPARKAPVPRHRLLRL